LGLAVIFLRGKKEKNILWVECGFLQGFLRKVGVLVWCFCGVTVVFCVVDVEFKQSLFRLLKM